METMFVITKGREPRHCMKKKMRAAQYGCSNRSQLQPNCKLEDCTAMENVNGIFLRV